MTGMDIYILIIDIGWLNSGLDNVINVFFGWFAKKGSPAGFYCMMLKAPSSVH